MITTKIESIEARAELRFEVAETIGGDFECYPGRRNFDRIDVVALVPVGKGNEFLEAAAAGRLVVGVVDDTVLTEPDKG
jgi:hypothetical protein